MKQWTAIILTALVAHVYAAPSHYKYKAGGDLDADASGYVESSGSASGGLYAGASAGSDVGASAGLGGEVTGLKSYVSSKSSSDVGLKGSAGFSYSGGTTTIEEPVKLVGEKVYTVEEVEPANANFNFKFGTSARTAPVEYVKVKTDVLPEVVKVENDNESGSSSVDDEPVEVIKKTVYVEPLVPSHANFKFNFGTEAKSSPVEYVKVKTETEPAVVVKEVESEGQSSYKGSAGFSISGRSSEVEEPVEIVEKRVYVEPIEPAHANFNFKFGSEAKTAPVEYVKVKTESHPTVLVEEVQDEGKSSFHGSAGFAVSANAPKEVVKETVYVNKQVKTKPDVVRVEKVEEVVVKTPEFLSFNDGKLGVNFGGYHASVGIGGGVGSNTAGGLYAEAGTPTGQKARAGLGGSVKTNGKASGGLYAGATAGGNVKASAGLGGEVSSDSNVGTVVEERVAVVPKEVIRETVYVEPVHSHKKLHSEFKFNVGTAPVKTHVEERVKVKTHYEPAVVKEVHYVQPAVVKEKHVVRTYTKPVEKRVEYVSNADAHGSGESGVKYNTQFKFRSNPNFFRDIFNIPIATLNAVGNFVGNTARNTGFSVENSASVKAGGSSYVYV